METTWHLQVEIGRYEFGMWLQEIVVKHYLVMHAESEVLYIHQMVRKLYQEAMTTPYGCGMLSMGIAVISSPATVTKFGQLLTHLERIKLLQPAVTPQFGYGTWKQGPAATYYRDILMRCFASHIHRTELSLYLVAGMER
jgi:hypothetical protein